MTIGSIAALFLAMVVLAAVPSVSVLAVSARAAASGFIHGVCVALGVVIGDIIFILFAIFGLALLVEAMGGAFFLVKYLGAAYLIWLGIGLWRSRARTVENGQGAGTSLLSSFMTGLLITLGDQKAIFFYLGFFPAFLDLAAMSFAEAGMVVIIAVIAVGGVKLGYAWAAAGMGTVLGATAGSAMNRIAACTLTAVGLFVIAADLARRWVG